MSKEKETVEFAFDKLEQYFAAAKQVIEQYGGDVAELGLNALRVDAAASLFVGLALLIPLYFAAKHVKKVFAKEKEATGDGGLTLFLGSLAAAIAILILSATILNIWNWVGLFYPELYAIHKFLL